MNHQATTFTKVDMCFVEWFDREHVTKAVIFSAPKNAGSAFDQVLTNFHSKFECSPIMKNCPLKRCTTFVLADLEVFK
jgi:hypothetical protein